MKITPKQTPGEADVKPSALDKIQNVTLYCADCRDILPANQSAINSLKSSLDTIKK